MKDRFRLSQRLARAQYTANICSQGHVGPNGLAVRVTSGPTCWACICGQPPGAYDHDFGDLPVFVDQRSRPEGKYTPEERRLRHIEQVQAWQRRNPDKFKTYVARYRSKAEVIERESTRFQERYHNDEEFRLRWLETQNQQKRLRYAQDPEYRAQVLAAQRDRRPAPPDTTPRNSNDTQC